MIFFPEESSFLFLEDQPSKRKLLKHCIFESNIISKAFSESNLCDTKTDFKQLHPTSCFEKCLQTWKYLLTEFVNH